MTEEQRAQLLAEWLKKPPGTDPPEGLDPEVVAAIWALRPDRAPRPRVTLDDILGAVKEGPYANAAPEADPPEQTTGEVIEFPRVAPPVPEPVEAAPPTRRRPRRSRWMIPVLGGFLAAAAAAALVIPVAGRLKQAEPDVARSEAARMEKAAAPPPTIPEAEEAAPTAAAPSAAPAATAAPVTSTPPARKAAPDTGIAAEGRAAAQPALEQKAQAPAKDDAARGGEGDLGGRPADKKAEEPLQEQTGLVPEAQTGAVQSPAGLGTSGYGSGGGGGYGPGAGLAASSSSRSTASAPKAAPSAPPPPNAAPSTPPAQNAAPATAPAPVAAEEPPAAQGAEKSRRREDVRAQASEDMDDLAADEAEAAPAKGKSPSRDAVKKEAAAAATDARASAWPLDYNESWYAGYPDVSSTYATARMKEQDGAWAEAAAAYASLLNDARVQVAQDAAWRAAQDWQRAGDLARAVSTVDAGLRKSSANTPFRARLLALRGDLLAQQGRGADAAKAWDEATRLNEAR